MQGDEEDGWIVFEDVLCAVAMVDVPVKDEYSLDAIVALYVTSADCDVVEETESCADFRVTGMVSRWADHAERVVPVFRLHDSIDGLDNSACADVRRMR